ncbi:MAG: hypothetical protein A2498_00155 [Lentisphaerae bacterium RIFOXYC12_FULL_60_16]|nr:MAG: hypothetical protein A2498_00155 [Lentisphaerae bacterium RIFOXYC12_FULL_60_16]
MIKEHQESITASQVLNAHTKKKGLPGPSQLTNEKLNIRISTPVISIARMFRDTTLFNLLIIIVISCRVSIGRLMNKVKTARRHYLLSKSHKRAPPVPCLFVCSLPTGMLAFRFRLRGFMSDKLKFDHWYAVNNTEIIQLPRQHLETFGTTILNYHLVSELMDSVNQVRIREGRMQAFQPKIITPKAYAETLLEGFGEEAAKYVEWLREHEQNVHILQYGYTLKQESFSEHVVTEDVRAVVERVKKEVDDKNDPMGAVVLGVDKPWDVCLIKLFVEVMTASVKTNVQQLRQRHLFDPDGGAKARARQEIESMFRAAAKDPSLINALGQKLQQAKLFSEYEDRFFSLLHARKE